MNINDCLFCKIIKREIPSIEVYEDAFSFAFLDINPHNHGHTLVVPKRHCRNMLDMEEVTASTLALAIRRVSAAVFKGVNAEGVNIVMNNEPAAGQDVFHAHTHIIPRFTNDGLRVWDKNLPYKDNEAKEIAERIKKEME